MLITFLGNVSEWENANYKIDSSVCVDSNLQENEFEGNNYISKLLECLNENKVLLILTESLLNSGNQEIEATARLFGNLYKDFLETDDITEEYIKSNLKTDYISNLEKTQYEKKIYILVIKDEDTESILEAIKNKLNSILEEHQQKNLYIDITHSYRYLPILTIFIIDILKNFEKNLTEGNIEKIIYAKKIDSNEYEIKDLTHLNDFMKLSKAIEDFYKKGSLKSLANFYKFKGEEWGEERIAELGNALEDLDLFLNLNILQNINENFSHIKEILEEIEEDDIEFPLNLIHNDLKNFIENITNKTRISEKQLELAIWHLKNDRVLLGLITLQESIRSKHMEDNNESDIFGFSARNKYKFSIDRILRDKIPNLQNEDKFNCCLSELNNEENKYIQYWCFLTNLRNAGGHNLGEGGNQKQIENIVNCKERYKKFLESLKNEDFVRDLYNNVNLSNYIGR